MLDHDANPSSRLEGRRGAPRRPICFLVAGDESRARAIGFRLEVLGHEVQVAKTGRDALDASPTRIHAYVIDDSVADLASTSLAESLRLDPLRSDAWIFSISRYHRPHREVSEGTGIFDRILVEPSDDELRALVDLAGYPRSLAGN